MRSTDVMTAEAARARPKRPKRTTEEVRRRVLDSAEELFAARGYSGTTTKEIARRAAEHRRLVQENAALKTNARVTENAPVLVGRMSTHQLP